ncbi:hypothetical protein BJV77DRAFT_365706 [Russula vinacea]|nr:hypothetical protein BJV77DRAFT_365706 [Russula vinacea]
MLLKPSRCWTERNAVLNYRFEVVHDLYCDVGKTSVGNRSTHQGSPRKIGSSCSAPARYEPSSRRCPGRIANNRLSSVLDTGKSVGELLANPESKHIGTPGLHLLWNMSSTWASRPPVILLRLFLTRILGMPMKRTRPPLTKHTMSRKMRGAGLSVQKTDCISFDSGPP